MLGKPRHLRRRLGIRPLVVVSFLAGALACNEQTPGPAVVQIILVTVGTLRADHLGAYGYARATTPFLDQLASRMVLFDDAVAQCGTTPQSLASMMTGRYPARDRILVRNGPFIALRPDPPTLAGWLGQQGIATHAITSQIQTTSVTGLDRGFDSFDSVGLRPDSEGKYPRRTARNITDRAARWIGAHAEDPFFLWIHYFDPHWPYEPPASFASPLEPLPAVEPGPKQPYRFDERKSAAYPLDAADLQEILEGYDDEISYLDSELRRLFDAIDTLQGPLVVFTADHGESLGEHGIVSHNDLYQSIIRVPLLIGGKDIPRGVRVRAPVMLVDVASTVLDLAGLKPLPHTRGRSLRPLWEGNSLPERERVAEYAEDNRAVLFGRRKIIFRAGSRVEVYDLRRDPGESTRLGDPALWNRLVESARFSPLPLPDAAESEALPEVAPEMIEELRSLGYAGSDPR